MRKMYPALPLIVLRSMTYSWTGRRGVRQHGGLRRRCVWLVAYPVTRPVLPIIRRG